MHGHSVGKLRIYQKPLSLNFEDVLFDDDNDDDEDKNKYLIFSKRGTQANAWIEGGAFMKVLNESFQIIIEAITGHTMMSDIAIDDVSILLDTDCINEDNATTPKIIEDDDEDDVEDVQSCVGRCFNDNVTKLTVVNATLLCNCNTDCYIDRTCCPDYLDVCLSELNSTIFLTTISLNVSTTTANMTTVQATTIPTTTVVLTNTTTITTQKKEPTTEKVVVNTTTTSTTPTTAKKIILIPTTKLTTILIPTTVKQTIPSTTTTTYKPIVIKTTTSLIEQEDNIIVDNDSDAEILEKEDDLDEDYDSIEKLTLLEITEKPSIKSFQSSNNSSLLIKYILVSLGVITTVAVITIVAIKRYKSSTNPLNYKQNSGKTTTKNVTEFSEVRFLTDDECLDFNIASSDSCLNSE